MPRTFVLLKRYLAFFLLLSTLSVNFGVGATSMKTPHVEAELISRHLTYQPGRDAELALRLKIKDHWHTYWRNPGDSGLPTRISWTLPEGFSAGKIVWPYPKKLPLGPLMNFGYDGEVLHLVKLRTPVSPKSGVVMLRAKADWLVCSDVCIPETAELSLELRADSAPPAINNDWRAAFDLASRTVPKEVTVKSADAIIAGASLVIRLPSSIANPLPAQIQFFPYADDLIANAGNQKVTTDTAGGQLSVTIPLAEPRGKVGEEIKGVLVSSTGWGSLHSGNAIEVSLPVESAPASKVALPADVAIDAAQDIGLMLALVFAFAGGLMLNIMPCVFPVLSIKVMSFAQSAQHSSSGLRMQGIAFLGGVIFSFWLLAAVLISLRAAGEAIGWGFQLQSPTFVAFLAVLFMLLGLNLSGVFEIGNGLQSAAGSAASRAPKDGRLDAFLSGVLATAVATPCTAPLMGAALGFTLSQPPLIAMMVFTAIAIGMAVPVVVLSFFPAWLRRLPRPGAWMETFKQAMAFPMYATVVWLVWVVGSQLGNDAIARLLFGLVILSVAAWIYGRMQSRKPVLALTAAALFGAVAIALAATIGNSAAGQNASDADWLPYSKEKVAELRANHRPVFVDFTASWCITCQVNKRVALNSDSVLKKFSERGVVRLKADWTRQDPMITAALAEFGRNAVPLYVYYPENGSPVVLPEILTAEIVTKAVSQSAGSKVTAERPHATENTPH